MGRRTEGWKLVSDEKSPYYFVRFTHDGRRYKRSTGCTTKGKAAKEAEKIYASIVNGGEREVRRSAVRTELEELMSQWLVEVEETKSSDWHATLEIYATAHWLTRWRRLSDLLAPGAVQRYISERLRAPGQRGGKLSPVTLSKELSGLRGFLTWCKRHHLVVDVPAWEAPEAISDYEPVSLSREEMLRVLAELPPLDRHPKRQPVRAYFAVMWATSLRRGTMARIRWEDLDLDAGTVSIRASQDKKRMARVLPLTDEAVQELRAIAPGVGLVFGKRDYRTSLRKAAERAGIDSEIAERLGNHSVRHSRLTDMASRSKNIAAIQYMAGHKDLASTMRYVHGKLESARELLAEIEGEEKDQNSGRITAENEESRSKRSG
jgi:integrase/recombinase XerD